MADSAMSHVARERIGGYRKAALTPDRDSLTRAARDARQAKREETVVIVCGLDPVKDRDEILRRADLLARAEMVSMAAKSAEARQLKARLRKLEAELATDQDMPAGDAA